MLILPPLLPRDHMGVGGKVLGTWSQVEPRSAIPQPRSHADTCRALEALRKNLPAGRCGELSCLLCTTSHSTLCFN